MAPPADRLRRVATPEAARELARWLRDASRRSPAVVVTEPENRAHGSHDVPAIVAKVDGRAEVWHVEQAEAAHALRHELPEQAGVFNGAARIYPVGTEWVSEPSRAQYRVAPRHGQSSRAADDVVRLVKRLLPKDGELTAKADPIAEPRPTATSQPRPRTADPRILDASLRSTAVHEPALNAAAPSPRPAPPKPGPRRTDSHALRTPGRIATLRPSPPRATPPQPTAPRLATGKPGPARRVPNPGPAAHRPAGQRSQLIEDREAAIALADFLLNPRRVRPVVVISTPPGSETPLVPVSEVAGDVSEFADVFVLPTDERSWAFAERMPDMFAVYGGASRCYPGGQNAFSDYRRAPLHFCRTEAEGARVVERLSLDAARAAAEAGLILAPPVVDAPRVSGTVIGTVSTSRALVRSDGGQMAAIRSEHIDPSLDINRIVAIGQRVSGRLDPNTAVLDVRESIQSLDEALAAYRAGATVPARVERLSNDAVRLELFPAIAQRGAVAAILGRSDLGLGPGDELSELFAVGDVVAAEILARTGDIVRVRVAPEWPDDAVSGASLLPGGPPWIAPPEPDEVETPDEPESEADDDEDEYWQPTAVDAMSLTIDQLRSQITRLTVELDRAVSDARLARLEAKSAVADRRDMYAELRTTRADLERQRARNRKTALRAPKPADAPIPLAAAATGLFTDEEEQFRFEVLLSWAQRVAPTDKPDRPLPDYAIGPKFFDSLRAIEGVDRRKLVDVVVDVLTADGAWLGQRDAHRLRVADGGGAPPTRRIDGAVCWRIPLQRYTPAARRLHYWRGPAGVELSRVVTHDDTEP